MDNLKKTKGIVLSGGSGTRLYPNTVAFSKQLLPIYSKPLIYYPISTLMLAGIKDICIITTPQDINLFKNLLGNGSQWGINLEFLIQDYPGGIAQCFLISENFIKNNNVSLILGDNIFYGDNLSLILKDANKNNNGATIFATPVPDPERFGVVEFNKYNKIISIEEKPRQPKSKFAITGLYFYDNKVVEITKSLKPSSRGELEITDVNKIYLQNNDLHLKPFGRGFSWFDTGTFDSMLDASNFVSSIEKRHGILVGSPEEIAFRNNWITAEQLLELTKKFEKNDYGKYLKSLIEGSLI